MDKAFYDKADRCLAAITADPRWDRQDELLFQVMGFAFYGFCFGFGRLVCLMDGDAVDAYVTDKLVGLGAGALYVQGMITRARQNFDMTANTAPDDVISQLIGIGHAHFAEDDAATLVAAIFGSYETLRDA